MRCLGKVTEGEPAAQGQQWGGQAGGEALGHVCGDCRLSLL